MNSTTFLPVLAELLVKSASILLAATLVDRAWRRASAAQRHAIWLAAFVALLLLPATRLVAPHWNLSRARPVEVRVRVASEPVSNSASVSELVDAPAAAVSAPTPPSWDLWVTLLSPLDWPALVVKLWLAGVAAMLGRRVLGSLRLRAMRRASIPAGDAQFAEARRIAAAFKVTRSIALRVSPECRVPLTWGTLRPVLMLPEDCTAWSPDRLRAALRHELAHIRRGDYALRLLADLMRALYWPNPLVWLASRALRTAQEQACDDLVLNAGTNPTDYATLLCEAARRCIAPHGAVAMAQPSTLESRIRAIVDATRDRRPLTIRAVIFGSAFATVALILSAVAQIRASDQTPATTAPAPSSAPVAPDAIPAPPEPVRPEIEAKFHELTAAPSPPVVMSHLPESPSPAPTSKPAPQVMIEATFVEIAPGGGNIDALLSSPGTNTKSLPKSTLDPAYVTGPQTRTIMNALSKKKGVNVLTTPRVTSYSKQATKIEIIREFRYPTHFEKTDPKGPWKATGYATKNTGVTLDVESTIRADGKIAVQLKPQVIDFLGFKDLDTGKFPTPSKPVAVVKGKWMWDNRPLMAIFSEHTRETNVVLENGGTVILGGSRAPLRQVGNIKSIAGAKPTHDIVVFVTASVVMPSGEKVSASDGR